MKKRDVRYSPSMTGPDPIRLESRTLTANMIGSFHSPGRVQTDPEWHDPNVTPPPSSVAG